MDGVPPKSDTTVSETMKHTAKAVERWLVSLELFLRLELVQIFAEANVELHGLVSQLVLT